MITSPNAEPVHLHVVVNDVAKTVKGGIFAEFAFSDFDGIYHTKAKAGMGINGDLHLMFLTNSSRFTPTVM